ncbi:virulence-associated E family protein [Calothrix sp. NIES-2098]|nr:virulence-associated E family protein [Calothrix sp. NIES-2098]
MDCALILYGEQGIRKSTFWRTLFGADWFSDDLGNDNDKDEKMKMHRFWCLEWGEFETVYKRKDVEELKRFLAKKEETFRTPYDRVPVDYKRGFVFVGTTNQTEILNDPSGDHRFWIIPVTKSKIPVEAVLFCRDKIWAAANALYKAGYPYMLTDEQEAARAERNRDYQVIDPWMEIVEEYVRCKDFVTTQALYSLLGIEPSRQDVASDKRISGVMRRLGWERGRESGLRGSRGWKRKRKIDVFPENQNKVDQGGSGGSAIPENIANQGNFMIHLENSIGGSKVDQGGSENNERSTSETENDPPKVDHKVDHNFSAIHQGSSVCDPPDPPISENFENSENESANSNRLETVGANIPIEQMDLPPSFNSQVSDRLVTFLPLRKQQDNKTRWRILVEGQSTEVAILGRGKADTIIQLEKHAAEFIQKCDRNWRTQINQPAMYGGDEVQVVGYDPITRKYQVQLSSRLFQYVKASNLSKPKP